MTLLKQECPCEVHCGKFGVPQAHTGHVRNCQCPSCRGRRNRRSGLRAQRKGRKLLGGVPASRYHGQLGNEENWRHYFRLEVKSGKQVAPVFTRFWAAEEQADGNKSIGDGRPFAAIFMLDDTANEGLVLIRLSDWRAHIGPRLEEEAS